MTVVFDAGTRAAIAGATSQTIPFTVGTGSNRVLYVFSVCLNSTDFLASATVTYGGTSLGSALETAFAASTQFMYVWRMVAPPSGTANVVVTPSAGAFLHTYVISVSGADQATPNGTIEKIQNNFSTSPVSRAVTVATGGMALSVLSNKNLGRALAPTGTATQIETTLSNGVSTSAASRLTDATTMGWTFDGGGTQQVVNLVVPVNPASAAVADLTGSITLDAIEPGGTLGLNPSGLAGSITLDAVAPTGTLGISPGSVTTFPFSRNTGSRPTGLTGVAVAILSDDANMTRLAGATSINQDGAGRITYTGAGLPSVGTSVLVVTREPDGKLGLERYTVA